jgi:hypothetical protein
MYLELQVNYKLSFNTLHLGSYLKDHNRFGALGFSTFFVIAWRTTTLFSSHMLHLFSSENFFPKYLICIELPMASNIVYLLVHPSLTNYPCFPSTKLVYTQDASFFTRICSQFNQVKKNNDTKYIVNLKTYQ